MRSYVIFPVVDRLCSYSPFCVSSFFFLADAPVLVLATIGLTQSLDTTGQVGAKEKGGEKNKKKEFECIWSRERETEENRASV